MNNSPWDDTVIYEVLFNDNNASLALKRRRKLAILLTLAKLGGNVKGNRRRTNRYILTRPALMPFPRLESAWLSIYAYKEDRSFITTMGVDVETFEYLLDSGFRTAWTDNPIPRNDVNSNGSTRPGRRSLDAAGGLGLLLHYLHGTMSETALQQIFAVVPSVLTRYVHFALGILSELLLDLRDARIQWPTVAEMEEYSNVIQNRHPLIQGAFGFLDGLSLPVGTSSDPAIKNSTYNGWLHTHKISNILVFAPDGEFFTYSVQIPFLRVN